MLYNAGRNHEEWTPCDNHPPILPSEAQLYRTLRLQALLDSPDAYASTHAAEAAREEGSWGARLAAAASSNNDRAWFAFSGAEPCGLLWCKLSAAEPGAADIYQMWVAPAFRGLGAGRALLANAVEWAASAGAQQVRLGVTAQDSAAMRLYLASGFRPAGPSEPLRAGSRLASQPMVLVLAAGDGS
jgi:ribosomal protein S18 acetylase RimI-like enzyme